jgi:type II secretory pathway component PulC
LAAERSRVDRGLVEAAMSRFGSIARRVRLVPVRGSNGVGGLRLANAPRDGLLASLGLRLGDLLRTVNGYKLGRPDDLMTLYSSLWRVPEVSIALERDGAPVTISYALR